MKILLIGNGKSIHIVRWANELTLKGHNVHLAFCSNDEPNQEELNSEITFHKLKFAQPFGYYLNARQLKKLVRKNGFDVVNVHYASGYGTLGRWSKLNKQGNYVLSVWGSDVYIFPFQSKRNLIILKKNLKHANKICSTSHIMGKKIEEIIGKREIFITPFGVNIETFKPSPKEENKKNAIITIAKALEEIYGIQHLIDAIHLLVKDHEIIDSGLNIQLNIAGSGTQKKNLEEKVEELGLGKNILFHGHISNAKLGKLLEKTDIVALASLSESFGVSAIEAMSCGIPVVATDADGFKEVILNGQTGIIVGKKSSVELYEALKKLILNKELRRKMGKKGRQHVEENYNFSKNVDEMIRIYKK